MHVNGTSARSLVPTCRLALALDEPEAFTQFVHAVGAVH